MNILFLIFNRPEVQTAAFQQIRMAKPKRLFIAADGPREGKPGEIELCRRAREIIKEVDWHCETYTLFRETNLGCRLAVSKAISWFFENVEEGVILEDDCVPEMSFFRYCIELLDKYRDVPEVMCVSGGNFQDGIHRTDESYYYSAFPHCWGWATWRSAWEKYDMNFCEFDENMVTSTFYSDFSRRQQQYWSWLFRKVAAGEIDSWATVWVYSCWINNGLTALPSRNLVRNVGFGPGATHTKSSRSPAEYSEELLFPLKHNEKFLRHAKADEYTARKLYKMPLLVRLGNLLRR